METTFTATLEKYEDNLWPFHVKVPADVYRAFTDAGIKRVVVTFNESKPVHNALLPSGKGHHYIKLSKVTMKEKSLQVGDQLTVHVIEDTSKYGMPIPEEMEELLHLDPEGEQVFHALTPGKIRSLLHKLNGYKSSDKRIEKSVIVLEHLKANNGKLDWKMLNEAWKQGL